MTDQSLVLLIVLSIAVMVVLALGFLLLYNTSQKRILKKVEEAHLKEIEFKNNLLASSIEVQERERSRIAKDLHDDIGSKLSIVNLNINLLKTAIASGNQPEAILDQMEGALNNSITRAREISHDLYPPILEKFGIQSALESLANQVTRTGALRVIMELGHEWKKFSLDQELHIYRIIQELIHNSIKHADASEIRLSSKMLEDERLLLVYQDNGKGISSDKEEVKVGLGMSSVNTRIELLKGAIISPETKEGYRIEFIL